MRSSFVRVDVVDVGVDVLVEGRVVKHGHLDRNAGALAFDEDRLGYQTFAVGIKVGDEFLQSAFAVEGILLLLFLLRGTLVGDVESDALVEERQFA